MHISIGKKAAFTGGQVAGQIFRDVPSILLLFYLTQVGGISPALAGMAVFIPKAILGSISDLVIGLTSDRLAARFPRRNWLLVGAICAPFVFVGIFAMPDGVAWLRIAYVMAAMTLYMIVFSLISVPYLAQYSEVSETSMERSDLMAWRHGYIGIGLLVGSALAPAMIHALGSDRRAYLITAAMLGLVCAASLLIAYLASRRIAIRKTVASAAQALSLRSISDCFADRRFILLLAVFVSHQVAAGMTGASMAFFLTYNLQMPDAIAQLGIIIMVAGFAVIIASPLWIYLSRRFGNRRCYQGAVIAHGLVMIVWGMSDENTPHVYLYFFSALIGLVNSGWGIMLLAFFSDVVSARNQEGRELGGTMAAIWTLGDKFGLALGGALLAGSLLSISGFTPHEAADAAALRGIALSFGFLPAMIHLAASFAFWRWVVLPGQAGAVPARG